MHAIFSNRDGGQVQHLQRCITVQRLKRSSLSFKFSEAKPTWDLIPKSLFKRLEQCKQEGLEV